MTYSDPEKRRAYRRAYYLNGNRPTQPHPRREALLAGLKTYQPANPCRNGHTSERSVNGGGCLECGRLRTASPEYREERKRRYHADIDAERARGRVQARKQREKHGDRLRAEDAARDRAKRAPGIAERKCQQAFCRFLIDAWNEQKRAERQAKNAELRAAAVIRGREKSKAWRAANPERQKVLMKEWAKTPKGREARRRKFHNRAKIVMELSKLQRGRCAYCRQKLAPASTHIDHIHPRAKGGLNSRRNYQLACAPCNISKSAKDPIAFSQERGMLI